MINWAALQKIAQVLQDQGGRAVLVGGAVRDRLLERPAKDLDVEVYGLDAAGLRRALGALGPVKAVGKSFEVQRVRHLDVDFSLPRGTTFAESARHRDLTINSMGLDMCSGALLDPFGGRTDLAGGVLRATCAATFVTDPLRGVRVAQLAARLQMRPDADLLRLCAGLDLTAVPAERLFGELRKLLLQASAPSTGLRLLAQTSLLRFFPEIDALRGRRRAAADDDDDDAFAHSCRAVDAAAAWRQHGPADLALMWAALLHDTGPAKPPVAKSFGTYQPGEDDPAAQKNTGPAQQTLGPRQATAVHQALLRLRAPHALVAQVETLVRWHEAPARFVEEGADDGAYRRLARALYAVDLEFAVLLHLDRACALAHAPAGGSPAPIEAAFGARTASLMLDREALQDVVKGSHLLARGVRPGPAVGRLLQACRDHQDATGARDPQAILAAVLGGGRAE